MPPNRITTSVTLSSGPGFVCVTVEFVTFAITQPSSVGWRNSISVETGRLGLPRYTPQCLQQPARPAAVYR